MEDRSSKVYFGLCMLVLIWIGVYWAWEPGKSTRPRISISQIPAPVEEQPDPIVTQPVVENRPPEVIRDPILTPDPVVDNTPRLIAPEFTIHIVKQNEILQDIAKMYYGDGSKWSAISRANPRVDPLRLRAGMELRIPNDPSNIQGIVEHPGESPAPNNRSEAVVEYTVQSGDSLSLIAQKFYGSSKHADFIYDSNRDTLRSKDAIRVGQVLKLPPLDP